MKRGSLSQHFAGIAAKRLSAVEASDASRQHEYNGSQPLVDLFGRERKDALRTRFLYLDDNIEPVPDDGTLTWYDSRANQPTRSAEWRLYYTENEVMRRAAPGDLLVLGLLQNGSGLALVARAGTTAEAQVEWLFGLEGPTDIFAVVGEGTFDERKVAFASRAILEVLGIQSIYPDPSALEEMLRKYGGGFPTMKEFSSFARDAVGAIELSFERADDVLVAWFEREEHLFLTLEKHLVALRLANGFRDVEEFMSFSLSVQNRRKARAGSALENHVETVLLGLGLKYSRGKVTEGTAKPDFIFPGIENYRDQHFPDELLTMLAAKSTCKDRWRQILPEARRIRRKHLLTLEPGISPNQTAEMAGEGVSLVVPGALHQTYRESQRSSLMTFGSFLTLVSDQQARRNAMST